VQDALHTSSDLRRYIEYHNGYVTLSGRHAIVGIRHRRAKIAAQMWPRALYYAQAIARLPFVKMVALTGALTMGNVEPGDDFDYLIITEPGRLWVTRFLIIQLVVKPAARHNDEVCPNYLLSEQRLTLDEHDLFHAHELAQMIPLFGLDLYWQLREANTWAHSFLPNALDPPALHYHFSLEPRWNRLVSEALLRTSAGTWLERGEMLRMQRKLATPEAHGEVALSPDCCKGHVGAHGHHAFDAFVARLQQIKYEAE
jgi:hypothetical protein